MPRAHHKTLVGGLLLAGALGYLGFAGLGAGWVYFLDVDTFVGDTGATRARTRLHGTVGADTSEVSRVNLIATFDLLGSSQRLPVVYHGPIPELFQPGREVVVEGALDEGGVFQADVLLTKCASKYEGHGEKEPTRPGTGG